jgi:anti-anti-sigma factor
LGESLWLLMLRGEHDLSTAPALEAAFARVQSTGTTAVVDLSEVTFIDSTALGILIRQHARGENVLLVAPTAGPARRLLDLVGLPGFFLPIFETRDDALGAVPARDRESGGTGVQTLRGCAHRGMFGGA